MRSLGRLGKRAVHHVKKIGKRVSKPGWVHRANKTLGKINSYAIPALTLASQLPYVGGLAGGAAKAMGAAQTGLKVASTVDNLRKAFQPSMGRSIGNDMSVESFHTPGLGAVKGNKMEHLARAMGQNFKPDEVTMDKIMGMAKRKGKDILASRMMT